MSIYKKQRLKERRLLRLAVGSSIAAILGLALLHPAAMQTLGRLFWDARSAALEFTLTLAACLMQRRGRH